MSMNSTDMAEFIHQKMMSLSAPFTPEDSVLAFSSGLSEYLEKYLECSFSWAGIQGTTPDPITSFNGRITFSSFNLSPPGSLGLSGFGIQIANQISNGIIVSSASSPPNNIVPYIPAFVFVNPIRLLNIPILLIQSNLTTFTEAMENCAQQIIDGIKLMLQVAPLIPATHGVFSATACFMTQVN